MSATFKILLSMFIWGSIGLFVKYIDMPSMELAFLRAVIASIVLFLAGPLFREKSDKENLRKNLPILILSGAAVGFNWVFLFMAFGYTTISNATLSYYLAPVFVILLSPLVLKEKLSKTKIIAAIGAVLGLFLILNSQSGISSGSYNHPKGIALGLTAAVFYASIVLLNKHIKGLSGYTITFVQLLTSLVVLLPFIIYRGNLSFSSNSNIFMIAVLGIVHTGIAYLLYFSGIKSVKAQSAALLSYIDPITAVILGTLFQGEPLGIYQVIGGMLILGSTFLGERKQKS